RVNTARRLLKRSFREQDRAFLVEGAQAVREALAEPGRVRELFVTGEARQRHAELVDAAAASGVEVCQASGRVLGELSETVTPQGIVAVCERIDVSIEAALLPGVRLAVLLAAIRDPGNAGTVLRTADAAGADLVVFSDTSVDPYNGKCVRASAGSLFHLPIVLGAPVAASIAQVQQMGIQVLAADGAAACDIDDLDRSGDLARPTMWVFGNEAWGLPTEVVAAADGAVRVPIHGRAESLNLAAAAAVCLYAAARAQRAGR
ncbi:MAG: TrmH family RNA methyltransferase, partial [Acidothermaceae bacterium]